MGRLARPRAEYAEWYPTIPLRGGNSPKQSAALCSANFGMDRLAGSRSPALMCRVESGTSAAAVSPL